MKREDELFEPVGMFSLADLLRDEIADLNATAEKPPTAQPAASARGTTVAGSGERPPPPQLGSTRTAKDARPTTPAPPEYPLPHQPPPIDGKTATATSASMIGRLVQELGASACLVRRAKHGHQLDLFGLSFPVIQVGRDAACHIRLEGVHVSRSHARLLFRENGWWIEDVASEHGTYLNNNRITSRQKLGHGAQVRIGDHILTFVCAPTVDELATTLFPYLAELRLTDALTRSQHLNWLIRSVERRLKQQALDDSPPDSNREFENGASFCVALFGIDGYPTIEKRLGRMGSDALLYSVADRATRFLAPYGRVGRIEHDEFFACFETARALAVVRNLDLFRQSIIDQPLEVEGSCVRLTVSIAVTELLQTDVSAHDILERTRRVLEAAQGVGNCVRSG